MGAKRKPENEGLPSGWVRKHGAIYYIVPRGMEPYWHHKKWFRLGKTEAEAWKTWKGMAANTDPMDDPKLPDVDKLLRRPIVMQGVYILRLWGQIVYVGRSDSVPTRIAAHASSNEIVFDCYSVFPAEGLEQRRLEQLLIAKYRPKYNTYDVV